jgi:ACS family D-galactonate transporter-like MFS transporter
MPSPAGLFEPRQVENLRYSRLEICATASASSRTRVNPSDSLTTSSTGSHTAGADSRRWIILAFLMALCFISHFNRASITSAGDERIMKQFGISPERMGMVYSAFLIVYTFFMIPGGWLIDRRGPRLALMCMGLGSAVFCAFTGGIGFGFIAEGQVWFALLVVRSLMGLMSTPLHPGAARAAGNWFPPGQQSFANGLITAASVMAYGVVHPVFGRLIDRFDWPKAFVITAMVTALLAVAWRLFAADAPFHPSGVATVRSQADSSIGIERPSPSRLPPVDKLLNDPRLWFLTLGYAAVGYFQYLFFYWLHYYFSKVLKMGEEESRFFASFPNLALAAGMFTGGWLTDRAARWLHGGTGRTLVPKLGMSLAAALLVCGIFAQDRSWIVVWFTLSLGSLGLCEASFWTMAIEVGRERGGTAAAIMNTGGNGIGLLAPMVTPWVGQHLGWEWGLGLGAVVGLLGALCWFGITARNETPPPIPEGRQRG